MALSAFPYVGGKTRLAGWITDHIPDHTVYVEPFGGSAAVLLNKPRSNIEVYNDRDCDVVQFFEIVRECPDVLAEIDGYALVSYTDQPEGMYDGWNLLTREHYHDSGARKDEEEEEVTERLILNYDPDQLPTFVDGQQQTLSFVPDGGPNRSLHTGSNQEGSP